MSKIPQAEAHDRRVERILLQTVPWDARKKGGDVLQECLRELWDKAVKIGFEFGEERAARTKKEGFEEGRMAGIRDALEKWKGVNAAAAERREKDLEEERMWGFEVGWRLCEEENKVRSAVSVETAEPADIVLDLDDILPTPMTRSVETQTDAPVAATPVAAVPPLDWAEDTGDLPVHPFPTPQPSAARDFSLRSGISQPFSSLQRRYRRTSRPLSRSQSNQNSYSRRTTPHPRPTKNREAASTPRMQFMPSFASRTSTLHVPIGKPPPAVDWDRDPRLRDLSRALTALGWVRPL